MIITKHQSNWRLTKAGARVFIFHSTGNCNYKKVSCSSLNSFINNSKHNKGRNASVYMCLIELALKSSGTSMFC